MNKKKTSTFFKRVCIAALFLFGWTTSLYAQQPEAHNAYKVTSYNLGAILDLGFGKNPAVSRNFSPLMIASSVNDILNSEYQGKVSWIETDSHNTHARGFALSARLDATQHISLTGAFGITRNLWTPEISNYQNESSWEANLGIIYRFLGNISYELHFGYMETGNLFTDQDAYSDVENIIMVSNRLTLSF